VWSVVKSGVSGVGDMCVVNVISCLYLSVNCGFWDDESLQMMVGSHGQD
jgi:hypothetical protein